MAQIRGTAKRQIVLESDAIARRVVSWNVARRLTGEKARNSLPDWFGGDPEAGDKILRQAIGNGSTTIQTQARTQAFREAATLTGRQSESALGLELKSLEKSLQRTIISTASLAVKNIAKKFGVRVAENTAAKAPGAVLDGPLPAMDIALLGWTIWDISKLSGTATQDTRAAVAHSAQQQNMRELNRTFSTGEARIRSFNAAEKLANCSRLIKVYNLRPIPEMRGLLGSRC